jgi:hypothetical protein
VAVAFDSVGPSSAGATVASNTVLTFSHTVVGSNVILLAGISVDTSADGGLSCTCKYGGTAMTSLGVVHSGNITAGFLQVFGIIAAAGTANVVATVAGGTPANISGGSIGFSGAGATVALAHGTAATANTPTATTVATAALASNTSGNLIAGFMCAGSGITSATAPSTSRFIKSLTGTGAAASCAGATSPSTGSSVTMAWAMPSDDFAELLVEILPFGGGGGPIRLAQQQSRALMKRRKSSQRPQFNIQSPDVNIQVQPVTASVDFQAPTLVPCIVGLAGGANGYFVDQTGAPRMVWGDAAWALTGNVGRWSSGAWQSDYDTYFTTRANQGITAIYTKPMSTTQCLGPNDNGAQYDGLLPFQGGSLANPSTGLTSAYWARIDYMLNSAANRGITIFLNAIGYNSDFNGGPGPLAGKTSTEFQSYGTQLGNRYAAQPNIVWMVADDYFGGDDTVISGFLTGLRSTADTHVIAIENYPESTSRKDLSAGTALPWGGSNAQFNFCYSYDVIYLCVEAAYTVDGTVPVIAGDGYFYQGNSGFQAGFDRPFWQESWWALSSGARGKVHGDEAIWQWQSTAQAAAAANWFWVNCAANIRTAVESLPGWHLLIPDTSSLLVTAGRGTRKTFSGVQYEPATTDAYVTASRVPDGSLALIYMSHATTITIDQTQMAGGAGHYTATWIDPVSGAKTSATPGTTYNSTAKGSNSQGTADWVLALQATAAAPPELAMAPRIAP